MDYEVIEIIRNLENKGAIETEQAQGCEFCEYYGDGYFYYAGYSKQIKVDKFHEYETENIKYCPMCGRELEKENNNE